MCCFLLLPQRIFHSIEWTPTGNHCAALTHPPDLLGQTCWLIQLILLIRDPLTLSDCAVWLPADPVRLFSIPAPGPFNTWNTVYDRVPSKFRLLTLLFTLCLFGGWIWMRTSCCKHFPASLVVLWLTMCLICVWVYSGAHHKRQSWFSSSSALLVTGRKVWTGSDFHLKKYRQLH